MTRTERVEKLAERFALLQIAAKKFALTPDDEWKSRNLATAAERYVAAVEAVKNDK